MIRKQYVILGVLAVLANLSLLVPKARAQVIGSYDNFDCFNDTGEEAEGFEIDVEDVTPADVTRIFPDNFPAGTPYIRYGTPDKTKLTPVVFPDGHSGVSIIYAAQYKGGKWVATWGSVPMPGTSTPIGDGTPYVKNPTYTTGDSCWTLGLGAAYPTSGCDHFGISLAGGVTPGKTTYHWLVRDPAHPGQLMQNGVEASLPPSPVLGQPDPGQPVVHAVAEAPEQPEYEAANQFGDAFWLKTFTSYSPKPAKLNRLQKRFVPKRGIGVTVSWTLLQRPPLGQPGEREDVEDDGIPDGDVQVVKRYEYFHYNGSYDPESHEAMCGGDNSCDRPVIGLNGKKEKGKYIGAHMNAYDIK